MKRVSSFAIGNFIGKDVRLVYPREIPSKGMVIEVDHMITPSVKLVKYIPPATAEIQRANGKIETIKFEEVWDPSAAKPKLVI